MSPPQTAVDTSNLMLKFESCPFPDRLFDRRRNPSLIVRVDVLLKPAPSRSIGIGNEVLASEVAHLAPIRVHAVAHVGTRRHESAETLLAVPQGFGRVGTIARHPKVSLYARQQFAGAKGFYQIIVCTRSHALDAIL